MRPGPCGYSRNCRRGKVGSHSYDRRITARRSGSYELHCALLRAAGQFHPPRKRGRTTAFRRDGPDQTGRLNARPKATTYAGLGRSVGVEGPEHLRAADAAQGIATEADEAGAQSAAGVGKRLGDDQGLVERAA